MIPNPGGPAGPAAELIALLTARQQDIAVAESLTGGLLAGALTDIPGASAVFRGGVVAYATELKAVLLGVDRALLAAPGAVSAEVAGAMAEGGRRTGSAPPSARPPPGWPGPDPAEGKPPGTVYVAASAGEEDPGPPAGPVRQQGRDPRRDRREALGWSLPSCGKRPDDYSVTLAANTATGADPTVGEGEYGRGIE